MLYDMTEQHDPPESIGDCWRACIATILGRDVPHFGRLALEQGKNQAGFTAEWLEERGYSLVQMTKAPTWFSDKTVFLASGPSPRDPQVRHVVLHNGLEVVHDPHPSRAGLHEGEIVCLYLIAKAIDP